MNIPDEAVEAKPSLHELLERVAFPDTPEERDAAENAIKEMLAQAWDEGADSEFQRSVMKRQRRSNPYRAGAE